MQTNKFSSAIKKFIAFVVAPSQNYGIFCHFGRVTTKAFTVLMLILNYLFEKLIPHSIIFCTTTYKIAILTHFIYGDFDKIMKL